MIYLILTWFCLALAFGQKPKIEGSKLEVTKANYDVIKPFQKYMDQLRFDKVEESDDPNIVMIANGHKPVVGRQAAVHTLKELSEWGPGLKWSQKEIIVSNSKDIAANMGTGTYKNLERLTYLVVLKKFGNRWLGHMAAFHQWVKSPNGMERVKREAEKPVMDIRGNNTAAMSEATKLVEKWDRMFQNGDIRGLTELYTADCVILDNRHQPKKGKLYAKLSFQNMIVNFGNRLQTSLMGISTSAEGDMVAIYGIWKDGSTFGNFLRILKREKGQLKVRYDMFSHETSV